MEILQNTKNSTEFHDAEIKEQHANYIAIIDFLELEIKKLKIQSKNLINENKYLKNSINLSEKELHEKECKLIIIEEKQIFYDFMIDLSKIDLEKEIIDIEFDLWHRIFYDRFALNIILISKYYKNIMNEITSKSIIDIIKFAKINLLINLENNNNKIENFQIIHQKSICLLFISKLCYESNLFNDSLIFILDSLNELKSLNIEKIEFISKIMACISLIYYKLNDSKNSLFYALESIKLLEPLSEKNNDLKTCLATQYMNLGYIFGNWNFVKEGIHFMELGVISYSLMLPEEEIRWMDSLAKLARICNDFNLTEDTMDACEKLIIFFHNKQICMNGSDYYNRNIFDIAVDSEEIRKSITLNIEVPFPIKLPSSVQHAVSELVIVFSKNNLFTGAQILSKWLKYCRNSNKNENKNLLKQQINHFYIQLDSNNVENLCLNLFYNSDQIPSTSKNDNLNDKINSTLKYKPFSSKLSALFKHKSNKFSNSISNNENDNQKLKKIFKIFKKTT